MKLPSMELLLDVGIALSKEKDGGKIFETILDAAMTITNCDGGTLYVLRDDALHFEIMITKSLGLRRGMGGERPELPPVPLTSPNVSSRAAVEKAPINIGDVYDNKDFNFTGTKEYDAMTGYRTVSMLTVPMENDDGDVAGVLQLINAMDEDGRAIPFAEEYERVIFSLASQAAICLTNMNYAAEITELLNSFVRVMSAAIDARSPYNANHTRNMVSYALKFIEWLGGEEGAPAQFIDADMARQFFMSIWLHDIGKLVVPLEVMDKGTRLGARLDALLDRLKIFKLQNEVLLLSGGIGRDEYDRRAADIGRAAELVENSNSAGFLTDEAIAEILAYGGKTAEGPEGAEPFFTHDELTCLTVRKGTLTDDERGVMESHVGMTRRMLSEMKFPKQFASVPGWAGSHHEFLNGSGYPDRISGADIDPAIRMLTILDIYDALTARDRPYKPAISPEKAFGILGSMAEDGQVDGDLLELFLRSGAWKG